MQPTSRPDPTRRDMREEDVDLGILFYKIAGIIHKSFLALSRLLTNIWNAFMGLLFYLKRNLIWLVIGTATGFGYSVYQQYTKHSYKATMTVKTNFNSAKTLYGVIDYFNALVSNADIDQIATTFNISPAAAKTLRLIAATPVKSELITSEIYSDQFLKKTYYSAINIDSFWTNTINYNDFKSSLTYLDYPVHDITVTSSDPNIFPNIQQALIGRISDNKYLQQLRSAELSTNKEMISIITSSINNIDTLKNIYNKRLATIPLDNARSGNVLIMNGQIETQFPELELYEKLLELRNDLREVKNKEASESDIIQVYSPLSASGEREQFLSKKTLIHSLYGLLTVLLILTVISIYKFLTLAEDRFREKRRTFS